MHINSRDAVTSMAPDRGPKAFCPSGSVITFDTRDCYDGSIQRETDLFHKADRSRINPASGPVYIEGAQPGDILRIDVLEIHVDSQGAMALAPGDGPLGERIKEERTKIIPVREGYALFHPGIRIPLSPMIGVIGTAPGKESVSTGTPGEHGSNMDCRLIQEGCSLYLPVNVPGALLAVGDLHGVMGDGETAGCGLEIGGQVKLRVTVCRDLKLPTPFIKTQKDYVTVASAPDMDQALKKAAEKMADFLKEAADLDDCQAIMLLSLAGDMQVCQVVNPLKTARMRLPIQVLESYDLPIFQ